MRGATLFFPTGNEVREQIQPYFEDLAAQSGALQARGARSGPEPTNRPRSWQRAATGRGPQRARRKGSRRSARRSTSARSPELAGPINTPTRRCVKSCSSPCRAPAVSPTSPPATASGRSITPVPRPAKDDLRAGRLLSHHDPQPRSRGPPAQRRQRPGYQGSRAMRRWSRIAGATEHFLPEEAASTQAVPADGGHAF